MRAVNYNHLYYFWRVAKLGSVSRASIELGVSQSTVSAQLKALEERLGEALHERSGRSVALTAAGVTALRYCDQLFEAGAELLDVLSEERSGTRERLRIGVADTLPKTLVYKLLLPLFSESSPPRLIITADHAERLLRELEVRAVDAVILDCPIPPSVNIRAYNHLLGESGVSFLASTSVVSKGRHTLKSLLRDHPLLLPTRAAAVRAEIDTWLAEQGITARIAAEFQDSALMKLFGRNGKGIFPIPSIVERRVCRELRCQVVGRIKAPVEKFYLITTERRTKSPLLSKLVDAGRRSTRRAS